MTKVINYNTFSFIFIRISLLTVLLLQITNANDLEYDYDILQNNLERDNNIFLTELDEPEPRFFNITYAPWVFILGALATTLLLAIPLAMALIMGSGGKEETYGGYGGDAGYGSSPSSGYGGGEYRYFFNSRKKRSSGIDVKINTMASKLHMLDESFRKFEMDDIGCQMLLSCEAAQLETMDHPIYGNLTPKIHKLLSTAKSSRQSKSSGTRVEKLLIAHREGRKQGSSCKKLYGDLCHNIMEKIDKAEHEDKARADDKILKPNEDGKKPEIQEGKDNLSFWEKKSKMAKFDMDKKMLMKKKKYRMKY